MHLYLEHFSQSEGFGDSCLTTVPGTPLQYFICIFLFQDLANLALHHIEDNLQPAPLEDRLLIYPKCSQDASLIAQLGKVQALFFILIIQESGGAGLHDPTFIGPTDQSPSPGSSSAKYAGSLHCACCGHLTSCNSRALPPLSPSLVPSVSHSGLQTLIFKEASLVCPSVSLTVDPTDSLDMAWGFPGARMGSLSALLGGPWLLLISLPG